MSVDQDQGQLRRDLIAHAAQLLDGTNAAARLRGPTTTDEEISRTIYTLKTARNELKLARRLGKQLPESLVLLDTTEAVEGESLMIAADIPQIHTGDSENIPTRRPLQERFVIAFLERVDRNEINGADYFHEIAEKLYEARPHDNSKYAGNAVGGIAGGLFRAERRIIDQLEQYLSDPEIPYPKEYVRKILAAAHSVPGHEEMTARELLDSITESRQFIFGKVEDTGVTSELNKEDNDEEAGEQSSVEQIHRLKKGDRKPLIILAVLEPNDDGTRPRYISRRQQAEAAYVDILETLSEGERKNRLGNYAGTMNQRVHQYIDVFRDKDATRADTLKSQREMGEILTQARVSWPEVYGNSSDGELLAILAGELPFPNRKPELYAEINGAIGQLIVNLQKAGTTPKPEVILPRINEKTGNGENRLALRFFTPAEYIILGASIMAANKAKQKIGQSSKAQRLGVHLSTEKLLLLIKTGSEFACLYKSSRAGLHDAQNSLWHKLRTLVANPESIRALEQASTILSRREAALRQAEPSYEHQLLDIVGGLTSDQMHHLLIEGIIEVPLENSTRSIS